MNGGARGRISKGCRALRKVHVHVSIVRFRAWSRQFRLVMLKTEKLALGAPSSELDILTSVLAWHTVARMKKVMV
jgi:hypothetical protein